MIRLTADPSNQMLKKQAHQARPIVGVNERVDESLADFLEVLEDAGRVLRMRLFVADNLQVVDVVGQHSGRTGRTRDGPHLREEDLERAVTLAEVAGDSHDDGRLSLECAAAARRRGRRRPEVCRVSALGEVREPEFFDRLDSEVL